MNHYRRRQRRKPRQPQARWPGIPWWLLLLAVAIAAIIGLARVLPR
jgi:hypothetical protein